MVKLLTGTTVPAENTGLMWSTLITGIVVVFLILIILVFILWALGKVLNIKKKPKENEIAGADPAGAAAQEPIPAFGDFEAQYEDSDDEEIIAVISAAIAAYGQAEGKQYRIASVRKREKALRSNWSAAGISENTRPF